MKIWLIYKVAMAFWINIHGCQPYPRNSRLCTKSAQKLLLATVHTPKNQTHPRPSLSASRWSLFGVFGQLSCSLRIESLSISGSQASPKNIEIWKIVIQWKLDLRKPDLRKSLDLRKIVATTDFLVHKLSDLRKIF